MKKINLLMFLCSLLCNILIFAQGHNPGAVLPATPSTVPWNVYTSAPDYRQDASVTNAQNTALLPTGTSGTDIFANYTVDTSAYTFYLVYTTNGSIPTKINGTVVNMSFAVFSTPNRIWGGKIPQQAAGTVVNYVIYVNTTGGTLAAANNRIASANLGIQGAWTEGNAYYSFVSPGGVPNSLLWLKADAGITSTTAGFFTNVSQWGDQSGNGLNATQSTAGNRPEYWDRLLFSGGTQRAFNFNPTIAFTSATSPDYFTLPSGFSSFTNGMSSFVVSTVNTGSATTSETVFDLGNGQANNNIRLFKNPLQGYFTARVYNGGTAATAINSSANATLQSKPDIFGYELSGGTAGSNNTGQLIVNGLQSSVATQRVPNVVTRSSNYIGFSAFAGDDGLFSGMPELILYNRQLSTSERNRVNSYLAIKYGIALGQSTPQNYVSSDGSVVWDAVTAGSFNNDIAGIGRDDASGLYQKISNSITSGITTSNTDLIQPIFSAGPITSLNSDNTGVIADKSFMMWANNGGSDKFNTAITGIQRVNFRMQNIWQIQTLNPGGLPSTVRIALPQFTVSVSNPMLLVSNTASFSSASAQYPMNVVTVDNVSYLVADVSLSAGQYFTFAGLLGSPGGVSGGYFWLRADIGTYSSTDGDNLLYWNDVFNYGTIADSGTGTTYSDSPSSNINFNPTIQFGGFFRYNASGRPIPSSTAAAGFAVGTSSALSNTNYFTFLSTGGSLGLLAPDASGNVVWRGPNTSVLSAAWGGSFGVPYMWSGMSNSAITPNRSLFRDGLQIASGAGVTTFSNAATTTTNIGSNGNRGEVISFIIPLTVTQRQQVESYLAIKYGISQGNISSPVNYLDGNGTVIWTGSSTYQNNVSGIGRDDVSILYQKQSKSVNSGSQVVIALGTVAVSNNTNSNTFASDKQFFVWGDDNGSLTNILSTGNTTYPFRFSRIWKTQNTSSFAQGITVYYPVSAFGNAPVSTVSLLYGTSTTSLNDGTASAIAQSSTTMINGVSYYVFAVPPGQVGNMQFFTFTGTQASPGGVTGESLWLRSDADTSTTVDGTNLSSWLDQSGNGNHAAQATGINQPLYRSANTGLLNFNPSIYFDGNTTSDANRDWLDITSPSNNLNTANSNYNIFASYSTQSIGQDIVCYISDGTGVKYDGYGDANTGGVLEFHLGTNTSNPDAFLQDRTAVGNTSISAYTHSIGIPFIQRGVYLNASVRVSVNGSAETSTATTRVNKTASNYRIGGHTDTTTGTFGRFFYGNLTDVIIYKSDLSAANKNRVESYLAIKNGVTLNQTTAQNYTASDGTTIFWDGTTNATYRNNIAGIARDDLSALNQKQAASQNSGIQPVVALGNIFDTNANNTNTFSGDLSALVWGSDTGSTNFATPFAFGSLNSRMTRFWKVQETGTVGTVKVALLKSQMPLNLTHHTLLVSSNDTFDGADTRTAMTLETIGGVEYYTATVLDFNSGDFFSFAALVTAPGGVITNLQRWYKGDAGVTTATGVSAWQDQAGGFTVDQGTAANQPTYNTASSLLNFNPSISFDGTNDVLTSATAGVISGSGATTYHFITTVDGTGIGKNVLNTGVVDTNDFSLRGTNGPTGHLAKVVAGNNSNLASIANAYTLNQASLTRAGYSGSANYISSEGGSETTSSAYTANVNNANIRIGSKLDGTFYWNGKIGEIITYNGKQSAADYIKVESYLAVKYGITKAGNYQNSSATVTWNSGGGYDNNIAGIAKDDASALNQKQSQSVNVATSQVVIALGTVAADNISNANTFSTDNQFFVWGDDNGSLTNILSTGNPTFSYRFTRIWKTQNTGSFAQGITVYYPVSVFGNAPSTTVSLLYGTSTTSLSNGTATAIAQTSTTTINGTSYYVFTVPSGQVSNMQFFTFTGTQTSPGGVSNNLALWLRADAGTNTTTDGASVTSWNDQSIWGRHAGNANLVNYRSGSNIKAINFNSVVDFDNADSRIYNITGGLMSTTTSLSQFFLIADVPTTGFSTQKYFGGFSSSFSSGGTFFNEAPSFRPTISAHLTSGASTSSLTFNPSLLGTKAMMGLVLNPPANTIALRQNGIQSASLPTGTSRVGNDGYILGNDNFDGWGDNPSPEAPIGEVIAYETNLSGTDLAKVESYLAIKYGMTLGTNAAAVSYLNSAGTSIWTGSTNYQNNIAGIGLDELSALNQKVSKSVNNGSVLTIATNADFTLSNDDPSRTAISNNLSALVIGDDNGSASTVVNTGLAPSFNTRLVRKWAIKNTNYTQNASLQFSGLPAGYSWNLVWDADGDFSSGAVNIGALNGSGQGTFTAAQLSTGYLSIMASAVCYKPAATIGTTLDSKYGITALGRAGSDHPDNWPMVRKGAWMVLEAKTKGLVINRLTTAQIAAIPAANLVEGMMIYDTTGNCLKVYTSTDGGSTFSWQCFSTQTCPD